MLFDALFSKYWSRKLESLRTKNIFC